MRTCDQCDEPAVKVAILRGAGRDKSYLCYAHAVERGLIDLPMESLEAVSEDSGYPLHAVVFVAEAIVRAERVSSANEVCTAVVRSAKERFGTASSGVLTRWGIVSRENIGDVYLALQSDGVIPGAKEIPAEGFAAPFTLADVLDASQRLSDR